MKRILIIEHNRAVRENLKAILELSDYECHVTDNGISGVQLALKEPIDLILCDVMMPQLDGFGVLNILSKKPATKHIPFIFLTSKSDQDDFRRGMNLGADDYLTEPYHPDDLLHVVEMRLEKAQAIHHTSPTTGFEFRHPELGYAALMDLFEALPDVVVKEKEVIFPEGSVLKHIYWVKKGRVKIAKMNDFDKEYIFSFQEDGKSFGYSAMFRNKPTGFFAVAMTDTILAKMDRDTFLENIIRQPDINFYFLQKLSNNLHIKEAQITNLAYSPIRKRVSDALFELSEQFEDGVITMSRDDLSHFVGTAKESLVRALSEFKKEGWILLEGNDIRILNAEKMLEFYG